MQNETTNIMKNGDELSAVAVPVSETMEREPPSQVPQEQVNPNGALSIVAASCGAQGFRTKKWPYTYEVFTMQPGSNGVPVRVNADSNVPALVAKDVGSAGAQRLALFDGPSTNGETLTTLQISTGICANNISALTTPSRGKIGTINQVVACTNSHDLYGIAGEALYRVAASNWCSSSMAIKDLNTNTVIGRLGVKQGCCSGARFSVSYPQEMILDHKLLLIACMNMFQLDVDSSGNAGMNAAL